MSDMQHYIAANLSKTSAMLGKPLPERIAWAQPLWTEVSTDYKAFKNNSAPTGEEKERAEWRLVWVFMHIMATLKNVEMGRLVPYCWEDEADWTAATAAATTS